MLVTPLLPGLTTEKGWLMTDSIAHFEGHNPRSCSEHRTTGDRAWCFDCHEWCYPEAACVGCRCPLGVEDVLDRLDAIRAAYREYDSALKRREHGGVAASRLADVVAEQLGGAA